MATFKAFFMTQYTHLQLYTIPVSHQAYMGQSIQERTK